MLRLIQIGNALPFSFPVDTTSTFLPGNLAQLKVVGNNVVCGLSDGSAAIGLYDDMRTKVFTANSINETVIVGPIVGVTGPGGQLISTTDIKIELQYAGITPGSFVSSIQCQLITVNGVIIFPAGTPLNFDADGDGNPDSIRTIVSYSYAVPNISGEDSTAGTGRATIHFARGIYETDVFDTTMRYPINANLFCNHEGKLTTKQEDPSFPGLGLVCGSPTAIMGSLQFLWL